MRYLDLSAVTTTIGMPQKSGTLAHIQTAYKEAIAQAIIALIGSGYSTSTMYILSGLVNSGTSSNWNISSGAVFYNGEVFIVNSSTGTITGSNVITLITSQSFYSAGVTADPVQFTDGISRNVHQINQMAISQGLSGSGIANYSALVPILPNVTSGNTQLGITGTYPNIILTVPTKNKIIYQGTTHIGDLNSSAVLDGYTTLLSSSTNNQSGYQYTFPTAQSGTILVFAQIRNNGHNTMAGFNNNIDTSIQIGQVSTSGFYFAVTAGSLGSSNTQDIYDDYYVVSLT